MSDPQQQQPKPTHPSNRQHDFLGELFKTHMMDDDAQKRAYAIREKAETFARTVAANAPDCADRTASIRKIREAAWTAISAISLENVGKPPSP